MPMQVQQPVDVDNDDDDFFTYNSRVNFVG